MIRLIWRDLLANARIWAGALLVAAVTGAVGAVVAAEMQTAVEVRGLAGLALASISGTVLLLATVSALVVLSTVAGLTISLQQRTYALWQLIGIGPARVRIVVTTQLLIVAVLGGATGCLAAAPALPALFRFAFTGSTGLSDLRPRFGVAAAAGVVLFVVVVVLAAGRRGTLRASRTAPVELLRSPRTPAARMGVGRWITGVACVLVTGSITASLPGTDPERLATPLMALAPLTAGALAAFGPLYLAALIRVWTALIPVGGPWYLARHATADQVSRSTAAINPLMVAVALAGGLHAASGTAAAARGVGDTLQPGTVALLAGGPLLLAVVGATVTVLMSSRGREREFALVRAAGATPGAVLAAAAAEAVVYVVTAAGLGMLAVAVTSVAGGVAAGIVPAWGLASAGVIAGGGLVLMVAATVLPTAVALRQPVPRSLAAE